jgi:hypothetical protein
MHHYFNSLFLSLSLVVLRRGSLLLLIMGAGWLMSERVGCGFFSSLVAVNSSAVID